MTPEAKEHFDKARQCLIRARIILSAGVGEDAGRNAYLAAFHAAQALIAERTGKDAKTHKGVVGAGTGSLLTKGQEVQPGSEPLGPI